MWNALPTCVVVTGQFWYFIHDDMYIFLVIAGDYRYYNIACVVWLLSWFYFFHNNDKISMKLCHQQVYNNKTFFCIQVILFGWSYASMHIINNIKYCSFCTSEDTTLLQENKIPVYVLKKQRQEGPHKGIMSLWPWPLTNKLYRCFHICVWSTQTYQKNVLKQETAEDGMAGLQRQFQT